MKYNITPGLFTTKKSNYKTNSENEKVFHCIEQLTKNGIISAAPGFCIGISDIIRSQLEHLEIQSRMVEVSLTISYQKDNQINLHHVGIDDIKTNNNFDTHVIVITETTPPILIDASISHLLPFGKLAVVEEIKQIPITNQDPIEFDFLEENIKLTYKEKKNQKVPLTHQISVVQRMETDRRIFESIKWLKILVLIAVSISILNGIRGIYDFYSVYIDKNNYWGPQLGIEIKEKLDKIDNQTKSK
jgi:hypothetical protein